MMLLIWLGIPGLEVLTALSQLRLLETLPQTRFFGLMARGIFPPI